jgi:protein involved in plasmid replication-relaxation
MPLRLTQQDLDLLVSIAEYRILPLHHLSLLHRRNLPALRRRLSSLGEQGFIQFDSEGFGRGRGRPERLVSLRKDGVNLLRERERLDCGIAAERATAKNLRGLDHHLLVNTFRIQLSQMQRVVPEIDSQFLSPTSPFLKRQSDDRPLLFEKIPPDERLDAWVEFIPDGVLRFTDVGVGKSLLFFLEVDMGTETIASPKRLRPDLRQKIVNYQTLLRRRRHGRYGKHWGCQFRGFRLLFLACDPDRAGAICRLVQSMPPSDFIWVADRGSLISRGLWADIWSRGGRLDHAPESILGTRKPDPSPTPEALT